MHKKEFHRKEMFPIWKEKTIFYWYDFKDFCWFMIIIGGCGTPPFNDSSRPAGRGVGASSSRGHLVLSSLLNYNRQIAEQPIVKFSRCACITLCKHCQYTIDPPSTKSFATRDVTPRRTPLHAPPHLVSHWWRARWRQDRSANQRAGTCWEGDHHFDPLYFCEL